jgi:cysteine desulfurase
MHALYLDHNASAPLLPEAAEAARAVDERLRAHPGALHRPGREAAAVLHAAREAVGALCHAPPSEVVLCSGASEANAAALFALVVGPHRRPARLLVGRTEHPSALEPLRQWQRLGLCELRWLPVDPHGQVDLPTLRALLPESDGLVLMAANHETGVLHPLQEVADEVRRTGTPWHCDTAQWLHRLPLDPDSPLSTATSLTLAGHKLGAPGGTGAWITRRASPHHWLPGRGEAGRRGGTLPVAAFAGLTAALHRGAPARWADVATVRDRMEAELLRVAPGSLVHGRASPRLPNTTAISLRTASGWVDGEDLVQELALRGLCASTGAACTSGTGRPSDVLLAMGCEAEVSSASLRLSWGPDATLDLIEPIARVVHEALRAL